MRRTAACQQRSPSSRTASETKPPVTHSDLAGAPTDQRNSACSPLSGSRLGQAFGRGPIQRSLPAIPSG